MITLIILGIGLLLTLGMIVGKRNKLSKEGEDFDISELKTPLITFIIIVIAAFLQPFAMERVDAGCVGVKAELSGDQRGISKYVYKNGWTPVNTWVEQLYEYPVYQQHIEYPDQPVITKGGFQTTIKPTFNYSLKPEAVGDMFQNLRKDIKEIEQGWLMTAIVGSVNDVANKWEVDAIFNDREKFEAAIVAECNKRTNKWFTISQLRTNIVPPEALKASIEAKTKAVQEAQAKMQQALVADANAKKMIAEAKGDSAKAVITAAGKAQANVIEAKGIAEAMKLKQQQLTPLYVDYLKWVDVHPSTPRVPSTILGSATPLLNIGK